MYPVYVFSNILIGITLSLLIGRAAVWFVPKLGLMDIPGILPHKKHNTPTPLAGGITIVLTLALGLTLLNSSAWLKLYPLLLPALLIFGLGLWDDFKRLSPGIKFIGQIIACALLMSLGVSVRIIKPDILGAYDFTTPYINGIITFVWVVGITNAFNLIDSMDGLVVGVSSVALGFLILVTLTSPQPELLQLLTLMIGTCIGIFFYNSTPARFFLGDSGAQTIGFLLAAITIFYSPEDYPQASSWFLPILILGVPIFDTSMVVFSRIRRRQPIYHAGNDHTYHRLVKIGLDPARAVMIMHMGAIILGCIAFIALNLGPVLANVLFASVLLAGVAIFFYLEK